MLWQTVKFVGSGFTLLAFALAISFQFYRRRMASREKLINSVPPESRAALVKSTLEFFDIDPIVLGPDLQYALAIEQIRAKSRRYVIDAVVMLVFGLVSLAITFISLKQSELTVAKSAPRIDVTQTNTQPTLQATPPMEAHERKGSDLVKSKRRIEPERFSAQARSDSVAQKTGATQQSLVEFKLANNTLWLNRDWDVDGDKAEITSNSTEITFRLSPGIHYFSSTSDSGRTCSFKADVEPGRTDRIAMPSSCN